MKKSVLYVLMLLVTQHSFGQFTNLHENFDVDCVLSGPINGSSGWEYFNPLVTTIPNGQWTCTPTLGRPNSLANPTPGIMCTGTYGSAFHLDTSYLITPAIFISPSYTGSVYLTFDTKTTAIYPGTTVDLLYLDTNYVPASTVRVNVDSLVSPTFVMGGVSNWVTHQVDITPLGHSGFYLAFRYTSGTDTGSIWYLDNVNISGSRLGTSPITTFSEPLTVVGVATNHAIQVSFGVETAGEYTLTVSDMMGRVVRKEQVALAAGRQVYTIDGLNLPPGMVAVRLDNGSEMSVVKAVVR